MGRGLPGISGGQKIKRPQSMSEIDFRQMQKFKKIF